MRSWYDIKARAGANETEIILYDEIGGFGISASQFIADLQAVPASHRLVLRIHSPGGSVLDGNAIANAVRNHPGGVTTHIDGLAASMASVVAIAGNPANMAANGLLMIHNVSGGVHGDSDDMRRTADLMDKVQETVVQAYVSKTGMSKKRIKEMMDAETWMDAKEAKAFGFIDTITEEAKISATFDLSRFRNAPRIDTQTNTKAMIIETPEYLALQAEHKTTCELATTLKTDLEAKAAEVATLSAKLSEAQTKITSLESANTELKASSEKAAADHAAALADFNSKVELAAQAKLAATGSAPVALGKDNQATKAPKELRTQLEAITDPTERIRFYRTNKDAIDAAYRA